MEQGIVENRKTSITVIAKPGNLSHSLFAILKTLPEVDLTFYDSPIQTKANQNHQEINLLIVDQDIIHKDLGLNLKKLKYSFPNAKIMLLENRLWYTPFHFSTEVDYIISKSTSAWEFLMMIKRLTSEQPKLTAMQKIVSRKPHSSFEPSMMVSSRVHSKICREVPVNNGITIR